MQYIYVNKYTKHISCFLITKLQWNVIYTANQYDGQGKIYNFCKKIYFFYISAKNLYKIFIFHKDVAVSQ